MKKIIRLTEGELHNMLKRCLNEAINELDPRTYASYADKRRAQGQHLKAFDGEQAARDAFNRDFAMKDPKNVADHYRMRPHFFYPNGEEKYDPYALRLDYTKDGQPAETAVSSDGKYEDDYSNHNYNIHYHDNPYSGPSKRASETAKTMRNGDGKYITGRGWVNNKDFSSRV